MKLIRTFYPVGQGAFYAEKHIFNEIEYTIVYDCGSTTLSKRKLERRIKAYFAKDHPIDILFISHFHADHINGIEFLAKHCKIQKVIIPYLDNDAKILVKVSNYIGENYEDTRLMDNLKEIVGSDTSIIEIKQNEIGYKGVRLDDPIKLNTLDKNIEYSSGSVFIPFKHIEWFFIPFNYKDSIRKKQFISELSKQGSLTLADIDTIDKIKLHKDKIRKAYKAVDGNLNVNSMVLFSGTEKEISLDNYSYNHLVTYKDIKCSCLYTGDIDLTRPRIVDDIKKKLGSLFTTIGTLQIPHHGSKKNFKNTILRHKHNISCAIISYGTNNKYSHPSSDVIYELQKKNIETNHITRKLKSLVYQR